MPWARKMSLSEFIRAEYHSIHASEIMVGWYGGEKDSETPERMFNGQRWPNIIQMWRAKYAAWEAVNPSTHPIIHIDYESALNHPENLRNILVKKFRVGGSRPFSQHQYDKRDFYLNRNYLTAWSSRDRQFIKEQLTTPLSDADCPPPAPGIIRFSRGDFERATHNGFPARDVFQWLREEIGAHSVLDIGCGRPWVVGEAESAGVDMFGVCGGACPNKNPKKHKLHDFTCGVIPFTPTERHRLVFDLAWCVGFLGGMEQKYSHNYMDAFQQCRYALVSVGSNHDNDPRFTNCADESHWLGLFHDYGLQHQPELTQRIRELSPAGIDSLQHALVFSNRRFDK